MLSFIRDHWQIIFSGIGTAIVAAALAVGLRRSEKKAGANGQSARAGAKSQIVQAGHDAKVGNFNTNSGKK